MTGVDPKKTKRKDEVGNYECQICHKVLTRNWSLGQHIRLCHGNDERPFSCSLCPYKSKLEMTLKAHFTNVHTLDKPFKCPHPNCSYVSKQKHYVSVHIKKHHDPAYHLESMKAFKCPQCPYATHIKNDLMTHALIHSGEKPWPCTFCEFRGRTKGALTNHMRIHTGERPYKCDYQGCDYTATQPRHLQIHQFRHTGERPFSCKECPYRGRTRGAVKDHVAMVHRKQRNFSCHLCGVTFYFKSSQKLHMMRHLRSPIPGEAKNGINVGANTIQIKQKIDDPNEIPMVQEKINVTQKPPEPIECSTCHKFFEKKSNLKRHMRRIHNANKQEKNFVCDLCPYRATNAVYMKKHKANVHNLDRRVKCPLCPCHCTSPSVLAVHLRVEHPNRRQNSGKTGKNSTTKKAKVKVEETAPKKKRIKTLQSCPHCSHTTRGNLKLHLRTHSQERSYACPLCPFRSNYQSQMNVHMRSHTGEKPFKCSHPGCQSAHIQAHEREHRNERLFPCQQCDYKAVTSTNLRIHVASRHEKLKRFHCPLCDFSNYHRQSIEQHIRVHTGEKPFECHFCPYRAATSRAIAMHEALVHKNCGERRHKCDQCDYSCMLPGALKIHKISRHGNISQRPFKYQRQGCGYAALTKQRLNCHTEIHDAGRSFACPFCPHRSRSRGHLKSHLKGVHQGGVDQTESCAFSTKNRDILLSHLQQKHQKMDAKSMGGNPKEGLKKKETDKVSLHVTRIKIEDDRQRKSVIFLECKVCGYFWDDEKQLVVHLSQFHQLPTVRIERMVKFT